MVELIGTGVNDGIAPEFIHCGHDAVLELLFGCDPDLAQDRAGEFGEEALDEIEPGAVRKRTDGPPIGSDWWTYDAYGVHVEESLGWRASALG
jgi:hypothetical protein